MVCRHSVRARRQAIAGPWAPAPPRADPGAGDRPLPGSHRGTAFGLPAPDAVDRGVDGGIFDNAPIGVAVDLAEGSSAVSLPFGPTAFIFVDPDHRRLSPVVDRRMSSNIAVSAQLITDLIGTARETELARAIRDERWQRTTQSTLSDIAQLQTEAAAIQEEMARVAEASGAAVDCDGSADSAGLVSAGLVSPGSVCAGVAGSAVYAGCACASLAGAATTSLFPCTLVSVPDLAAAERLVADCRSMLSR